ncbi:hypothetical protein O5962_28550, partial [Escherichia coli]|nr:hypothetical protein [Escherichia coli]
SSSLLHINCHSMYDYLSIALGALALRNISLLFSLPFTVIRAKGQPPLAVIRWLPEAGQSTGFSAGPFIAESAYEGSQGVP